MTDQDFLDSLLATSAVPCNLYELTRAYQVMRCEVVRLRADVDRLMPLAAAVGACAPGDVPAWREPSEYWQSELMRLREEHGAMETERNKLQQQLAKAESEPACVAHEAKLRNAIKSAGFAVMETSGDWSIHDVSEKAKSDQARELAYINESTAHIAELELECDRLRAVDVANKEYIAEKPLVGAYHVSPHECPIWHDGCNCTVEALAHNINRAERAENEVVRLRNLLAAKCEPT